VPGGFLRRVHLFEIHEQPWLPHSLRDAVTDFLQWILNLTKVYASVEPRLRAALNRSRASEVVDLCSGAGGPWLWMLERLAVQKTPVNVWLTDKYPNEASLRTIQKRTRQRLRYHLSPVEATRIPSHLQGFRTLFNAFHHFPPEQARALVREAVERREGIAIFEVPRRSIVTLVGCLLFAFGALLAVPLMRPLRWSRVFWTYVIPLAPLILCFDGLVSCLRAYSLAELSEMAQIHAAQGYRWEFGEEQGIFFLKVTYLVGFPESGTASNHWVRLREFAKPTGYESTPTPGVLEGYQKAFRGFRKRHEEI
jgi:hypothetical protein